MPFNTTIDAAKTLIPEQSLIVTICRNELDLFGLLVCGIQDGVVHLDSRVSWCEYLVEDQGLLNVR
jgi:hypothetical protein